MDDVAGETARLSHLTPREREVLRLRCEGKTQKEISQELSIAIPTVKTHCSSIYEKLGLDDPGLTTARRNIELLRYGAYLSQPGAVPAAGGVPEAAAAGDDAGLPEPARREQSTIAVLEDEIALLEERTRLLPATVPAAQLVAPAADKASGRRRWTALMLGLLVMIGVVGGLIGSGATWLAVRQRLAPAGTPQSSAAVAAPAAVAQPEIAPTLASAPAALPAASPASAGTGRPVEAVVCGESERVKVATPPFVRSQGLTAFTPDNTGGAVISPWARVLAIDERGVFSGYFGHGENTRGGVVHFDKATWGNCNLPGEGPALNVNALAIDALDRIWVGSEEGGVSVWDGERWRTYTVDDGLPSNKIYSLTIDADGDVWAGTWEGVAKFDGERWTVPYTAQNNTLFSNHVHAIAFDAIGDIWIGHIDRGVSQYRKADGEWIHHTVENGSGIGGNKVRGIAIRSAAGGAPESVWVATADGGVSVFEQGRWIAYGEADGLPSDDVGALALDKHRRVWAATTGGTAWFDGERWTTYDTLWTVSLAFGPACEGCPYTDEHVWTGTAETGLTVSRLPYPDAAMDVLGVRFFDRDGAELVQPLAVAPGEAFRPEITIRPRSPYQLLEGRGDMLVHLDADDAQRFGAYERIPVKGTIEPGQPFTFTDYDNFFVAPQLETGETERTFTSTWRTWVHGRYAGPPVGITFSVRKP